MNEDFEKSPEDEAVHLNTYDSHEPPEETPVSKELPYEESISRYEKSDEDLWRVEPGRLLKNGAANIAPFLLAFSVQPSVALFSLKTKWPRTL